MQSMKRSEEIIDRNFPAQYKLSQTSAKRIAVQCTRRSGKSTGLGRWQLDECFKFPGSAQLYLGLVRTSARGIMWEPIYKHFNDLLKLQGKPHETYLELVFPNKSKIILAGADATKKEMEKYLGGKYRSIVIDEAGSFKQDLRKLVYENLEPCLTDWDGWICLAGTPTEITNGLFFDICNGKEGSWELHQWMTEDNPYMRENWERRKARMLAANPRIVETPAYRRMHLNQWVIDTDSLVYKFKHGFNEIDELPAGEIYTNVLGVDLGYNDASAFTVLCYGEHDPTCYVRFSYKRSNMIISEVAERIKFLMGKYNPTAIIIDNASKQAVEELKQKYLLPLQAAEKLGKHEFIEIMNSDFITGHIKLLPGAEPLKKEYSNLIWDKTKLKKEEHAACENHCADATLYPFRFCYQFRNEAREEIDNREEKKIEEWFDEQDRDEEEDEWDRVIGMI